MREVRIFVSSPGDVDHERRRIERVVERLNGEFAEVARLQTVRWETEFYRADKTFQAQIPEAAECDIVVAIFRSRIGTELPAEFARLPDGSPYPSGTAYEVLSAIAAAQAKQLPDVYVFRYSDPPLVRLDDPDAAQVAEQWRRLKSFFDTWFVGSDGPFKAAFHHFSSSDDFEGQIERLLRGWLEEKVLHGRAVPWPIATKGSPFRGLEAFGAKHSAVFFGRSRDIARAVDLWKDAAERGCPFLIVVGASGSGKSSLARAGLVPRLTVPGVVPAVDAWRVAAMRPSELADGPLATLATRLLDGEGAIPEAEAGRPPALPELAASDYRTPAELAALLAHADSAAVAPLVRTLDRVGEELRKRQGYERPVRCDLVVLIDQLDELFGEHANAAERAAFARLLNRFAESGRIWVVATLRADLYDRFLAEPDLLALKTAGAAYDLAPPGPAELAEIVRKPAEAAELTFDRDPATGEGLDELLLREADRPDMLPLLQLVLNRLFEARMSAGGETRLTHAAYEALGGLSGIIDREAERAIAPLGDGPIAQLPALLRQLVAVTAAETGDSGTLTTRTVPLAIACADVSARRLADALVAARILLISGEGESAGLQLAHQRVIADWRRARDLIAANQDFYRVRDEIEAQRRRWAAASNSRDRLIGRGVLLAEAEAIAARFGDELSPETRAFIAASGRRARRRQRLTAAAAVSFGVLAAAAGTVGVIAWQERQHALREEALAQANLDAAKQTVNSLVFNIAQGLRSTGLRGETVAKILDQAQSTVEALLAAAPNDAQLRHIRAAMLDEFAQTYLAAGDLAHAKAAAEEGLTTVRALVSADPGNPQYRRDLAVLLDRAAEIALRTGDSAAALKAIGEELAIVRALAAAAPGDLQAQRDVSQTLGNLALAQDRAGDWKGATDSDAEAAKIIRAVVEKDPDNPRWQRDLSVNLVRAGDRNMRAGNTAAALGNFTEALAIRRKLAAAAPDDTKVQHDLWLSLTKVGDAQFELGDKSAAAAAYDEAAGLIRRLADGDPGNAVWQSDLAMTVLDVGYAKRAAGDAAGAAAAFKQALDIRRRMAALDPENLTWQREVAFSLDKIGETELLAGDTAAALSAYEESLTIARAVAAKEPSNVVWQNDIVRALLQLGELKERAGDTAGAIPLYDEAVTISRKVKDADLGSARFARDVAITLNHLGDVKLAAKDTAGALAAYQEALTSARSLAQLSSPVFQADLAYTLARVAKAYIASGDLASARAPLEETAAIRQALAEKSAGNVQAERDAIVATVNLGDLVLALKDNAAALAAYQKALASARRLAVASPDAAEWQIDLILLLGKVATASPDDRTAVLTEALSIAQTLQQQGKLTAAQANWPDLIKQQLAQKP